MKTAFLHGDLEVEIFMEQLEGFEIKAKEKPVCKLRNIVVHKVSGWSIQC